MVGAALDVSAQLDLADAIDAHTEQGEQVWVHLCSAHEPLMLMAILARCRQRAERFGGSVLVEPTPRGQAGRMWRLGLRSFLGRHASN